MTEVKNLYKYANGVSFPKAVLTDTCTAVYVGEWIQCFSTRFSLQVSGTGATADSWIVDLEGSNDEVNADTVLTHATGSGNGKIEYSGNLSVPMLWVRINVKGLSLGSATNIKIVVVGIV